VEARNSPKVMLVEGISRHKPRAVRTKIHPRDKRKRGECRLEKMRRWNMGKFYPEAAYKPR